MDRSLFLSLVLGLGACGGKPPPAPAPVDPAVSARPLTRVPIEEEPEEGVTIVNGRGRMDTSAIEAGLAPHAQALTDCYLTNVNQRRWLGGKVNLHWDIRKDGVVTAVRLAESDLGNWPIEKCLLEVARAATFAPPTGGDADFQLPLEFTSRGRSISWDEEQGLRAVGGQVAKLEQCANGNTPHKASGKATSKPPVKVTAPEDVLLTVYVGPGGKAQSVGFSGGSVIDELWAECAQKVALGWRLPDPRGQMAKLAVRYPLR